MKSDIGAELETLGLSPNEAKVYMAGLRTGTTTAQKLAAKAAITRPTTYIILEGLVKRGLMNSYLKGDKRVFAAANPNQLSYIVNGLRKEAHDKEEAVGKIVEALGRMVEDEKAAASVRLLDDAQGTRQLQEDILESGATELLEVVNLDEARKWIPPVYKGDIREKLAARLKTRSVLVSAEGATDDRPTLTGSRHESRTLDMSRNPIHGEVLVYGDRVALTSYAPAKSTVIMRDRGIAETMKTLFKSLWEKGEK